MYIITSYSLFTILPIITILLIIPYSYCHRYENCSQPFHCGGIKNISYPFWGGNHSVYCGFPGFELFNCHGEIPLIRIGSRIYRIQEINYARQAVKVARQVLGNKIPQALLHKTTLNSILFRFPSRLSNSEETGILVKTGDKIYVEGTNITCNSCFPVPIDQNKARVLASTTSSTKNVLHDAIAKSFSAQWLSNNTNSNECTQSNQDCSDGPHAAPVKCYIQERRWLVKRRGAPFPSPSNRHGQRWLKERSGLPFASRSYKLGQRSLVKSRSPSQRYDQGERWPVDMGVPSASPLLLVKQSDDPFPSAPYARNQIWPAESGVVPSPSPSSGQHGQSGSSSSPNSQPGQSENQNSPTPSSYQSGDDPSPTPPSSSPSSQPGKSDNQNPPTPSSSQSGDGPSPTTPSSSPSSHPGPSDNQNYPPTPSLSQSGDGPSPTLPSSSPSIQPGKSDNQIPPAPSLSQSRDGQSPVHHVPRGSGNGLSLGAKVAIGVSSTGSVAVITLTYIIICKSGCTLSGVSIHIILPIKIFLKKLPSKTGLKKNKPKAETFSCQENGRELQHR